MKKLFLLQEELLKPDSTIMSPVLTHIADTYPTGCTTPIREYCIEYIDTILREYKVLAALELLRHDVKLGNQSKIGICKFMANQSIETDRIWQSCYIGDVETWQHYEGYTTYPVPSDNVYKPSLLKWLLRRGHSNHRAYSDAKKDGSMWSGTYGANRMDLLEHFIHRYKGRITAKIPTVIF